MAACSRLIYIGTCRFYSGLLEEDRYRDEHYTEGDCLRCIHVCLLMVCPVFHRTVDRISIVVLIVGEYGLLCTGIEALLQGLRRSRIKNFRRDLARDFKEFFREAALSYNRRGRFSLPTKLTIERPPNLQPSDH